MQITLAELEKALAPIEIFSREELTFDVGSLKITLRVMTPEEEIDVQRHSNELADETTSDDPSAMQDYLERFRMAVLSHAIIAIGDLDLRGVKAIETGDTLENGVKIKVPKAQALRQLMLKWTGNTRSLIFFKYGELLAAVERKAESALQFDPADLDAEIQRLEQRVESLKKEKEKRVRLDETPVNNMVKALVTADQEEQAVFREHVDQLRAMKAGVAPQAQADVSEEVTQTPAPEATPTAPEARRSILPVSAPPPTPPPSQKAQAPSPTPAPPEVRVPTPRHDDEDSFVDMSDSDSVDAAVHAENQRLMAMRRTPPPASPPPSMPTRITRPPHLDALAASGDLDQLETFRQPTEELVEKRGSPVQIPINPGTAARGATNPRFQPVKR